MSDIEIRHKVTPILQALGIRERNPDVETEHALLFVKTPWVAPYAYLHVIFKGAPPALVGEVSREILIPALWERFLIANNGANIFADSIYFFGLVNKRHMFNRQDPFFRLPYNILDANRITAKSLYPDWVIIAGYGYDKSLVHLNATDSSIRVVAPSSMKVIGQWNSVDEWLNGEIKRLSLLFDLSGRLMFDQSLTLPGQTEQA